MEITHNKTSKTKTGEGFYLLGNKSCLGFHLINVIDDDGSHRDDLRGPGGHDRHQDEEEDRILARRPQQLLGNQRSG